MVVIRGQEVFNFNRPRFFPSIPENRLFVPYQMNLTRNEGVCLTWPRPGQQYKAIAGRTYYACMHKKASREERTRVANICLSLIHI